MPDARGSAADDGGDAAFRLVLALIRPVVVSDVVVTTTSSVLTTAWSLAVGSVVRTVMSLFRIGELWERIISTGLAVVAVLVLARGSGAGIVVLAVVLGLAMSVNAFFRLAGGAGLNRAVRSAMVLSGFCSAALGLLVLVHRPIDLGLIGTLLVVQTVVDGVTLEFASRSGRRHR
jgi:membrane protein HdeD